MCRHSHSSSLSSTSGSMSAYTYRIRLDASHGTNVLLDLLRDPRVNCLAWTRSKRSGQCPEPGCNLEVFCQTNPSKGFLFGGLILGVGTQAQLAAQGHWTRTETQRTAYPTNCTLGDSSTTYVVFRKDRIYSPEQRQAVVSASPQFQFMKPGYRMNTILKMPEDEYRQLRTLLQHPIAEGTGLLVVSQTAPAAPALPCMTGPDLRHKVYEAAFSLVRMRICLWHMCDLLHGGA